MRDEFFKYLGTPDSLYGYSRSYKLVFYKCFFELMDQSSSSAYAYGVYIVYLLSKDGESLYLTLNQGCTELRDTLSKKDTVTVMRKKANEIISYVNSRRFHSDTNIDLGNDLTELAELYQEGCIFYKKYTRGAVPEHDDLLSDLSKMIDIYSDYVKFSSTGGETSMETKDILAHISQYISFKGFSYQPGLIENFYLSLKSKPFVILAGTSGTGKTRLVRLFSEACGATCENDRFKLVAVRPDWSDSSDLFGYLDLNGKFAPGEIIEFVKNAQMNLNNPYFFVPRRNESCSC